MIQVNKMTITKRNFLLFSILLISYSVLSQKNENQEIDIISEELSMLNKTYKNSKVYLDISLNDYLVNFLEEKKISNVSYSEFNNFNGNLSLDEIKLIFNDYSVESLINKITTSNLKADKLIIPNNIILNNIKKEKSNIGNDGLKMAEFMTRKRIHISIPVIINNGDYGLIAYSRGIKNSMSGGVHIYKKTNNNWIFYTSVDGWIE